MDGETPRGDPKATIRIAVDNAEPVRRRGKKESAPSPQPSPPEGEREQGGGGFYGPPSTLPEDAPVKALGKKGNQYFFLDSIGQLLSFKASEIGRLNIISMFGNEFYLKKVFPEVDKDGIPKNRWKHDVLAGILIDACTKKGVWDPFENVRGPGTWTEADGTLIIHCGDVLYADKKRIGTGLRGNLLYPRAPRTIEPKFGSAAGLHGPAAALFTQAKTWNWARGEIDAKLFVGLIGCQMLGAAASWRAQCWVTGGFGTGKSTLQLLIRWLHGKSGMIKAENATQAGIARAVDRSSLPVSLDEFEAKADSRQVDEVIELMRIASSGGTRLRARTDGTDGAVSSQLFNCFIASSIRIANLQEQDRSRMAILDLQRIAAKEEPRQREPGEDDLLIDADDEDVDEHLVLGKRERWELVGRELKGRLVEQWHRYRKTFRAFRRALIERQGHGERAADQFGAIGAAFDCLMHDGFDGARTLAWAEMLPPVELAETQTLEDGRACLSHLLEQMPDIFRGGAKETMSHWIGAAREELLMNKGRDGEAQKTLANYGIRVYRGAASFENVKAQRLGGKPAGDDGYQFFVAIANAHAGLGRFFAGTYWKGDAGVAAGGWAQELRRLPFALYGREHRIRIGGVPHRVTILPWESVFQAVEPNDEAAIALPDRVT